MPFDNDNLFTEYIGMPIKKLEKKLKLRKTPFRLFLINDDVHSPIYIIYSKK